MEGRAPMITGVVQPWSGAVVRLVVRGPDRVAKPIDAVVDTGFTGELLLPQVVIDELRLPAAGREQVILGNGQRVTVQVYSCVAVWDDTEREVIAYCTDTDPLIGVAMLWGSRLEVEFQSYGRVAISPLTCNTQ